MYFLFVLQEDLSKETLLKQFRIVKSETNTSHVQQFGNKVKTGILFCFCDFFFIVSFIMICLHMLYSVVLVQV